MLALAGNVHDGRRRSRDRTSTVQHWRAGGTTFMTGEDGRVIVHPQFNIGGTVGPGGSSFMTGEDLRSIVHPSFNVGNDGRSIVHPSFNVGLDGYIATTEDANEASFNVGNDGRMIAHPSLTSVKTVA